MGGSKHGRCSQEATGWQEGRPRQAKAEGQGWRRQEEQAGPQVHHRLHPPRRGWHHELPGLREVLEREDQGRWQDQQLRQGGRFGQGEEQDQLDFHHRFLQEVLEVLDQEVLEEEQLEGLAPCCCQRQGQLRAQILPNQQRGRRRRGGQRISLIYSFQSNLVYYTNNLTF